MHTKAAQKPFLSTCFLRFFYVIGIIRYAFAYYAYFLVYLWGKDSIFSKYMQMERVFPDAAMGKKSK